MPEQERPRQLEDMLRSSITASTPQRIDELGIRYVAVKPLAPFSYQINSVVVRSTVQFRTADSGYIVEIAIYRQWEGNNTNATPAMKSGINLFHPMWDSALESIEKTSGAREWEGDATLAAFFNNGATSLGCGFGVFLNEVEVIQEVLRKAQEEVYVERA